MVRGLDRLRDHFAASTGQFVLIGGVAVQLQFDARGIGARATKDVDMVVRAGAADPEFLRTVWEFVESGGYRTRERGQGATDYFRFLRPTDATYPHMLELFAAKPSEIELFPDQRVVPLRAGEDVRSLSAILMDDAYQSVLTRQVDLIDGLPAATPLALILLKTRAWLDLDARASAGAQVDKRSLRKHRDDVFKLAMLLVPGQSTSVADSVCDDLDQFLRRFPPDSTAWPAVRQAARAQALRLPSPVDLIDLIHGQIERSTP